MSQVFIAGVGLPFCFEQLSSNEAVDRAAVYSASWAATRARGGSTRLHFSQEIYGMAAIASMCVPALGVEEGPATVSACTPLVGAMALKHDFGGTAYIASGEIDVPPSGRVS